MRLNESGEKSLWSCKSCDDKDGNVHEGMPLGTHHHHGVPSLNRSPSYRESGMNPGLHGDSVDDESLLERQRFVALHRSLFSAILSLLVGMIIWEAEDPCLPLVAALFTVVGMSMNSVVQFFSTMKNKPASDAVALLSLNWFMLGALTYPTLPRASHILAPPRATIRFADRIVSWLFYYNTT